MGPDLAEKFQVFAVDSVKAKNSAQDVYNMAVESMSLDKSRYIIVKDTHIGVGAAVAAETSCIVTVSSYSSGEDFTGSKMVVDELGDDPDTGVTLDMLVSLL